MSKLLPMILVFAGPNGSGKTTVTDYFEVVGTYTNADDIVASTRISNEEAAELVDQSRYRSIENFEDFTFETVLSSKYKIDILEKAKDKGYFIKCVFVLTKNPKINVARVKARVHSGGHSVAHDKIIDRYHKSLANVKKLMELCDILHVYDNSGDYPERIVRKHKKEITIYTNKYWKKDDILNLIGFSN